MHINTMRLGTAPDHSPCKLFNSLLLLGPYLWSVDGLEKQSVERHPRPPNRPLRRRDRLRLLGIKSTVLNKHFDQRSVTKGDFAIFLCLTYHGVIVVTPIFLRKSFGSSDSFIGATTSIGGFGNCSVVSRSAKL